MASIPIGGAPAPVTYNDNPRLYRAITRETLDAIGSINRACRAHSIAPSRFGRDAVGNPRLSFDLMNGRTLRPKTRARIAGLGEA
jgi:hypothetical protein